MVDEKLNRMPITNIACPGKIRFWSWDYSSIGPYHPPPPAFSLNLTILLDGNPLILIHRVGGGNSRNGEMALKYPEKTPNLAQIFLKNTNLA
jgi:hypothetical protein